MTSNLLRFAYIAEFLLALIAVLLLWTQVGGQVHLDLMPWYAKLFLSVTTAFAVVRATAEAISQDRAWNMRTILWSVLILLLIVTMAGLTYYYHLQEGETDDDGNDVASVVLPIEWVRT
jgi:hypothetical protein